MLTAVCTAGEWFLVGGLGSQSDNKLQIYSFATNQWRKGANLPFKAGSASSAVHNGKVRVRLAAILGSYMMP